MILKTIMMVVTMTMMTRTVIDSITNLPNPMSLSLWQATSVRRLLKVAEIFSLERSTVKTSRLRIHGNEATWLQYCPFPIRL